VITGCNVLDEQIASTLLKWFAKIYKEKDELIVDSSLSLRPLWLECPTNEATQDDLQGEFF